MTAPIHAALAEAFGPHLEGAGFVALRPSLWARARGAGITDLFQVQALKGASYGPRWGFSLAWVPHLERGRLRWHRTLKGARFDLVQDPLDWQAPGTAPAVIPSLASPDTIASVARGVAGWSVPEATGFWPLVTSPADLAALLPGLRARPATRFGFDAYVAHGLTVAFTLAAVGWRAEARAELVRASAFAKGTAALQAELLAALDPAG